MGALRRSAITAAVVLALHLPVGTASAEEALTPLNEVTAILRAELATDPSGVVAGAAISYPDGSVFVAVAVGERSISQCQAGQFCGWASANYTGSFHATSGTGVTKTLTWSAKSYRNNRTQAARLYNSGGTAST